MRSHAEDVQCMFQITAEGDQGGRGQAKYPTYRNFLGIQKLIRTKVQLLHKLEIAVLGEHFEIAYSAIK